MVEGYDEWAPVYDAGPNAATSTPRSCARWSRGCPPAVQSTWRAAPAASRCSSPSSDIRSRALISTRRCSGRPRPGARRALPASDVRHAAIRRRLVRPRGLVARADAHRRAAACARGDGSRRQAGRTTRCSPTCTPRWCASGSPRASAAARAATLALAHVPNLQHEISAYVNGFVTTGWEIYECVESTMPEAAIVGCPRIRSCPTRCAVPSRVFPSCSRGSCAGVRDERSGMAARRGHVGGPREPRPRPRRALRREGRRGCARRGGRARGARADAGLDPRRSRRRHRTVHARGLAVMPPGGRGRRLARDARALAAKIVAAARDEHRRWSEAGFLAYQHARRSLPTSSTRGMPSTTCPTSGRWVALLASAPPPSRRCASGCGMSCSPSTSDATEAVGSRPVVRRDGAAITSRQVEPGRARGTRPR